MAPLNIHLPAQSVALHEHAKLFDGTELEPFRIASVLLSKLCLS